MCQFTQSGKHNWEMVDFSDDPNWEMLDFSDDPKKGVCCASCERYAVEILETLIWQATI